MKRQVSADAALGDALAEAREKALAILERREKEATT